MDENSIIGETKFYITVNFECWCGDGYARGRQLEEREGYIEVPGELFDPSDLSRESP